MTLFRRLKRGKVKALQRSFKRLKLQHCNKIAPAILIGTEQAAGINIIQHTRQLIHQMVEDDHISSLFELVKIGNDL